MNPDQAAEASAWPAIVAGSDEEFSSFLDFPELSIDFASFDANPTVDGEGQNPHAAAGYKENTIGRGGEDGVMEGIEMHASASSDGHPQHQHQQHLQHQQAHAYQQRQRQQHQQHFHGHGRIPSTPNSAEMHGSGHSQYSTAEAQQTRAFYESLHRKQQEPMIFTPLISPAVTPLDNTFQVPEFTVPGEYFSPLTSPALQAQNHAHTTQRSVFGGANSSAVASRSATTSPVDGTFDLNPPSTLTPSSSAATKSGGRKSGSKGGLGKGSQVQHSASASGSVSSGSGSGRAVWHSPAMKPQRKSRGSSTNTKLTAKEVADLMEGVTSQTLSSSSANSTLKAVHHQPHHPHPHGALAIAGNVTASDLLSATANRSDSGSISPEPLSEILMPPPATPKVGNSTLLATTPRSSPYLKPQGHSNNAPATPASLMRIQAGDTAGTAAAVAAAGANARSSLPTLDTRIGASAEDRNRASPSTTPTVKPQRQQRSGSSTLGANTPVLSSSSSMSAATPISAISMLPSPAVSAASPVPGAAGVKSGKGMGAGGGEAPKKGRKRNSSSHPSPALRPRISPSIQPLLPEGTPINAETSALLLASKSNYQNILEGTHLPGVSYPEALSENLTSKRTSHKIAEQGRRNRINSALQEMASLLPPPSGNGTPSPLNPTSGPGSAVTQHQHNSNSTGSSNAQHQKTGSASLSSENSATSRSPQRMANNSAPTGESSNSSGSGALPSASTGSGAGAGGGALQSSSKASTVEMAIDYIRALQSELKDARARLVRAEGALHKKGLAVGDDGEWKDLEAGQSKPESSEQEKDQQTEKESEVSEVSKTSA